MPLLAGVPQIGGRGEGTGESWPLREHTLKHGDGGYPASQFIAYHVYPVPARSGNAIKLTLCSLPACSLRVKHACAIRLYSERLSKCIEAVPRG